MDRQDAKPSRPSLIADQRPAAAAAAPARILADMENRKPAAASPVARSPRMWLWVAAGVVAVAVLGWWALAPDAAPARVASVATVADVADEPLPGAARIVDAAPANPAMPQMEPVSAAASQGGDPLAMLGASDETPAADPFAAVVTSDSEPAPAARPAPARRPARPKPAPAAGSGESDLLSTLLQNIESSKQTAAADAASLDELVRQLRDEDAPSTRRRSEQIQSNLRDCPAPNTVEGLKCRQEICAVYAGRDPACPALN